MKLPSCDREQEVLDALRSGRWASVWGEEIRQHVAACAVCAEVASVVQEFQKEGELARAELQQPGATLPSAGLVWWKAQLAARRAAAERAAEPIVLVERAASVLVILAAVGLGIWQWPRIAVMLEYFVDAEWPHRLLQGWFGQTPNLLLAGSAAACLTLVALAAYVVWREE